MEPTRSEEPPPRVLLVIPDQWSRALLRAALREEGYDAVGARHPIEALRYHAQEPDRGPVRLVVADQDALGDADDGLGADILARVLARHGDPPTLLLGRATHATPAGPWRRVIRRPASMAEVVEGVRMLLPLPPASRHPLS
ncbi:MAG TPA: hypothetical protein VFY16_12500 [Gemmatimonadaceae bacterium]|nr:hypothetical protein [Gemmatimonadaceae bacterium]